MTDEPQTSIFDELARAPSRRSDPATSKLAAASVDVPAARRKALAAIAQHPRGATYHDVIQAASYTRLTELHRNGLIECTGTRPGPTGRQARVWVVTPAGRLVLEEAP